MWVEHDLGTVRLAGWFARARLRGQRAMRHIAGLTIYQRFQIISLLVVFAGMLTVSWWVGQQIERGVIQHTATTTGLYVESFIAPLLQDLATTDELTPASSAALGQMLNGTLLGDHIVGFMIWDTHGRVLYSTDRRQIGRTFALTDDLLASAKGAVISEITGADDQDHIPVQHASQQLLAIYSPVHQLGTQRVVAVAEFYQDADSLFAEIRQVQLRSWVVIFGASLLMYISLLWFVRWANTTISAQAGALQIQVHQLTDLLAQNGELHERVRRASLRSAELNERFLRRLRADLHDGPSQYLGLALMRLDALFAHAETCAHGQPFDNNLIAIQQSLEHALGEVRLILAGLGLPELQSLSLSETIQRVVRVHEQRSGSTVQLQLGELPEQAHLSIKITVYRVIQEALTNSFRHGGGVDTQVRVALDDQRQLQLVIADRGCGFNVAQQSLDGQTHLGLIGMRERVECLGGRFSYWSEAGRGTTIMARLALDGEERANDN